MNNTGHDIPNATGHPNTTQHYSFVRRMLFPYNGMEILSPVQTVRLILSWVLFFLPGIWIITFIVAFFVHAALPKFLLALGFALLIDMIFFGGTAWLCISWNNRAVRVHQERQEQQGQRAQQQGMTTTRGGRYGS